MYNQLVFKSAINTFNIRKNVKSTGLRHRSGDFNHNITYQFWIKLHLDTVHDEKNEISFFLVINKHSFFVFNESNITYMQFYCIVSERQVNIQHSGIIIVFKRAINKNKNIKKKS